MKKTLLVGTMLVTCLMILLSFNSAGVVKSETTIRQFIIKQKTNHKDDSVWFPGLFLLLFLWSCQSFFTSLHHDLSEGGWRPGLIYDNFFDTLVLFVFVFLGILFYPHGLPFI